MNVQTARDELRQPPSVSWLQLGGEFAVMVVLVTILVYVTG